MHLVKEMNDSASAFVAYSHNDATWSKFSAWFFLAGSTLLTSNGSGDRTGKFEFVAIYRNRIFL